MDYQSDIELAQHFKDGDQKAFQKVFERFYRPIMLFAYEIIKDKSEAEDITVNTFSKLWKIHQNFDTILNVRAFLYITARNQCLNYLKKIKREIRDATQLKHHFSGENEDFILTKIIQHEIFEMIRQEINSIPPQRRDILKMIFFDNCSSQEIANKLNLSVNTVRNTKAQGIQQLRAILLKKKIFEFLLPLLYMPVISCSLGH